MCRSFTTVHGHPILVNKFIKWANKSNRHAYSYYESDNGTSHVLSSGTAACHFRNSVLTYSISVLWNLNPREHCLPGKSYPVLPIRPPWKCVECHRQKPQPIVPHWLLLPHQAGGCPLVAGGSNEKLQSGLCDHHQQRGLLCWEDQRSWDSRRELPGKQWQQQLTVSW